MASHTGDNPTYSCSYRSIIFDDMFLSRFNGFPVGRSIQIFHQFFADSLPSIGFPIYRLDKNVRWRPPSLYVSSGKLSVPHETDPNDIIRPHQERIMTPERTEHFIAWLDKNLSEAHLSDSDLARRARMSHSVLSKARKGILPKYDACVKNCSRSTG